LARKLLQTHGSRSGRIVVLEAPRILAAQITETSAAGTAGMLSIGIYRDASRRWRFVAVRESPGFLGDSQRSSCRMTLAILTTFRRASAKQPSRFLECHPATGEPLRIVPGPQPRPSMYEEIHEQQPQHDRPVNA
jgi:hypothetical protein